MNFFGYFKDYYINQKYGVTYVLTEIIACFIISFCFNKFDWKKYKSYIRLFIDFCMTWCVEMFLSCFFYYVFSINGQDTSILRYFIWPLISLVHTIYPKDMGKYFMRFLCAVFSSSFTFMAINLSGAIGNLITDSLGHYPDNLLLDYTFYIVFLGLLVICVFFKTFSPFKYKYVKNGPVILIDIVFLLAYLIAVFSSILNKNGNAMFNCILYTFLLSICFICYTIFYLSVKSYNYVLDYQAKALKAESEKNQLEISMNQYEELHRIRHELRNQMNILEIMLKEKKYDEMSAYFADISEKVHVTIDYIDTGNALVNSVLNMELSKAKGVGIPLVTHISIKNHLNINPQDITSLLTNLIDNALEAENRCQTKDAVDVQMVYENEYLFIKVTNTISYDENPLLLKSRKPDRKNHGYGTKIIKSICAKYNGFAKFSVEQDKFKFDGMLYLPEETV